MGQTETVDWESRKHFLGITSQLMRQVLVDHARSRAASKRDGGARLELDLSRAAAPMPTADLVALDDALKDLASMDERKARAVELRYFGGLEMQEIAEVMEIHVNTVRRDLHFAICWLKARFAS
jgi:RNA polymerase sigma-70 factor (ECF subfamily)